mmetsp:Transcript_2822/g.6878  ORF Transcript_2822/g.6878 Transcript_2822/m.6878 type:complete len:315 (-) Transcript_2822:46-990(-)
MKHTTQDTQIHQPSKKMSSSPSVEQPAMPMPTVASSSPATNVADETPTVLAADVFPWLDCPVAKETPLRRRRFLVKVYGLLFFQVLGTALLITALRLVAFDSLIVKEQDLSNATPSIDVRLTAENSPANLEPGADSSPAYRLLPLGELLLNVSMIGSLISILALVPLRLRFPLNVCVLAVFTVCEALLLGISTLAVPAVLMRKAALLSVAMFCGLTAYARQGTHDYQFVAAFTWNLVLLLLMSTFGAVFMPGASLLHDLALLLAVLVGGAVILFDTWRITYRFRDNEHVLAALELYLDCVNVFVYILRALSRRR